LQYLKSAEYLFRAANESTGELRQVRLEKVDRLLDIARRLEGPASIDRNDRPDEPEAMAMDDSTRSFLFRQRAEVHFDDVAGLEEAKEQIRLRLIYPLEHPEQASRYQIKRGGGVLLYGPPGTGKTLLARAVAGEIQAAFFTAKPSELMSRWVGQSERNVARLFEEARQCPRAIVFIDEVEAMVPAGRSSGSTVMQRVVPQILAELQGVRDDRGELLFMAATNEPWAIDPAVLRPGRFDAKVYVGLPEMPARRRMLDLYLARRPLAPGVDLQQIAASLEGYSGADIADICERCAARVFLESIRSGNDREIALDDFTSVLSASRPSVSPRELEKYERWGQAK
jgi:transitional endoplasmic reticulum ATPase